MAKANPLHISPAQIMAHDLDFVDGLSDLEVLALHFDPNFWLRPDQHVPTDARYAGWIAARGYGKSLGAASYVQSAVEAGDVKSIALIAQDEQRAYDVQVKPLLDVSPPWCRAEIYRDKIIWPNGAVATIYTPESPGKINGFNGDLLWMSELTKWSEHTGPEAFNTALLATRLKSGLVVIWDTTSNGYNPMIAHLLDMNEDDPELYPIMRGTTFDNPLFGRDYLREQVKRLGKGTRKYNEELLGMVYDSSEGALWQRAWIDGYRVDTAPVLTQVVIGYDPGASEYREADGSGIVAVGADAGGHLYVIGDYSAKHSISSVGHVVFDAYLRHRANGVIAERNRGVAFVVENLRAAAKDRGLRVNLVPADTPFPTRHDPQVVNVKEVTSRGQKLERAEPIVALYSQGLVHHVGSFSSLEKEQLTYDGTGQSPNAFDACNMALTEAAGLRSNVVSRSDAQRRREADAMARINARLQFDTNRRDLTTGTQSRSFESEWRDRNRARTTVATNRRGSLV